MTQHLPAPPTELRDKIAQLMFIRIGSNLPPVRTVEEDEARVEELLKRFAIGGLILFNGRWPATCESLRRLQQVSRFPLMVGADIERGVGQQIRGKTLLPHAMAFDQLGEQAENAVERLAEITAAEARECGIHIAYAPVCDVSTNPRNPIIATRAFSHDPHRAAKLAAAYVRSAKSSGLLTCAKHFPGHGDTHQDSHDALPEVDRGKDQLQDRELLPFRAAISAGVDHVMTAHVAFPQLEPTGRPATVSRAILVDLLRGELGFQGVVCCDSLLMAGLRDQFATQAELVRATLQAGNDILLDVDNVATAVESLASDVQQGRLDEARIDNALRRIWDLKHRVADFLPATPLCVDYQREAQAFGRRAIVTRGTAAEPLPNLRPDADILVLVVGPRRLPIDTEPLPLDIALREHFSQARCAEVDPDVTADRVAELVALGVAAEHLIIAVVVKPAAWHPFGLAPLQAELVDKLTRSRPAVLVSLGVPQVLDTYPAATSRLCTYSDVPASQQALSRLLAGVP